MSIYEHLVVSNTLMDVHLSTQSMGISDLRVRFFENGKLEMSLPLSCY